MQYKKVKYSPSVLSPSSTVTVGTLVCNETHVDFARDKNPLPKNDTPTNSSNTVESSSNEADDVQQNIMPSHSPATTKVPPATQETACPREMIDSAAEQTTSLPPQKRKYHSPPSTTVNKEDELVLILTKNLWVESSEGVTTAMQSLCDILGQEDRAANDADSSSGLDCEVYMMAHLLGAPLAVVRAMNQHATNARIQELGCEALSCISNDGCETRNSVRIALLKVGGLQCALDAMKHFPMITQIQKAASNLIGNMVGDTKKQAQQVVLAGGLEATITAMQNHGDCATVQDYACFVLRRLLEEGGSWAAKLVVETDGINLILKALDKHVECTRVQIEGCMALRRLAESDEPGDRTYRQHIIDAKGLIGVSETIRMHSQADGIDKYRTLLVEAREAMKAILA